MKLVFLVGSIGIGGGNYVVIQHAVYAAAAGHDVRIAVLKHVSSDESCWHPGIAQLKIEHIDALQGQRFDLAIATWWRTSLQLHKLDSKQYAYFVQSIESRFFEPSQTAMRRLVDQTYELKLPGITEAVWIQRYLRETYGSRYALARNGIRKDIYTPAGGRFAERNAGKLRVLVEGPMGVPIKNTSRTLRTVGRARPDEAWLLTTSEISWYPGVNRLFSRVPIAEVAAIYRSCDVIVKLSLVEGMFGPPLEMFHCGGTAVVYDVSGHDEYIVDGKNALVAKMHDEEAVVDHIRRLRDDTRLLANLKEGARETAQTWPDWPASSREFLAHLEELASTDRIDRDWLVQEATRIRAQFAQELHVPDQTLAELDRQRAGWLRGVARVKRGLRPYKQLLGYIADGYR